jgi:sugar lactone lactonase YvrE/4-amino-4-deoxy-L-arabinose transferase-like glycosyltransferase
MNGRRKLTSLVLALVAIMLGFTAQRYFAKRNLSDGLIVYTVAAFLFVYAFRKRREEENPPARTVISWRNWKQGFILLTTSLLSCLYALHLFGQKAYTSKAWLLYLGSTVLFMLATYMLDNFTLRRSSARTLKIAPRHLLFAACLLIAAFMRLYRFDSIPYGTWYDEAEAGLEAGRILKKANYRPVFWTSMNHPSHLLYLYALSLRLFGESTQDLRLVSVAFGLAGVIAAYLFGREFFGEGIGLALASLIAVSRWHVNFSRIAMTGIDTPFFELLTLYFLLKGMRSGRLSHFAWAGLALGFGLCFYTAFRLFLPMLGLFMAHHALVNWRKLDHRWAFLANILIFSLAALLVVAPVAQYALKYPEIFWARTRITSIFRDKSFFEAIPVLRENLKKHFLMFNYRGDPNGRHNLPGEPMLDFVTSVLFFLGLAYSLFRFRYPRYSLLVLWLLVMLCGGIFSLEFEAPQSLRGIGSLPAAYVLSCVPLEVMKDELIKVMKRAKKWYTLPLAFCTLLALIGWENYDTYFNKQARDFAVWNAFSTAETITAERMASLGPDYDFHVISLYYGHPTLRFLAKEITRYKRLETTDTMPLRESGEREAVLFIDPERRQLFLDAKRYYPDGAFEEVKPPFGGPTVLYYCKLKPEQIRSIQGLIGRYYKGEELEGEPILERRETQLSFDWGEETPLPLPFSVRWDGILYVPRYGRYRLGLVAPAEAEAFLDESLLLEGSGEVELFLAKGNHSLRVEVAGGRGRVELYWQPPGESPHPIPQKFLYTTPPVTSNGLLGNYYPNLEWAGEPALAQIDPSLSLYFHIVPLPRPYSVEWVGKLLAPVDGSYAFGLESIDDSWLYIDEKLIVESHIHNQYCEGWVELKAGLHDIRVRYLDKSHHSHINLYWMPPGGEREIIPSEMLLPPQGAYPALPPPPIQMEFEEISLKHIATWGGMGEGEGEFNEPRDIAVDSEGNVYVADTGNRRVQKFDAEGNFIASWGGAEEEFIEPLAVVVNSRGDVFVLDSEPGWIYRFTAEGKPISRFGGPDAQFYHPRGMAIDDEDNIYIADTGSCRIVKYDVNGNKVAQFGTKGSAPGQILEPTDIAIDPRGMLYIVDIGNRRIQLWDRFWRYEGEWAIPLANAYNGSHLSLADDGTIFITIPEHHQVFRYSPEGELLSKWGGPEQFRIPVGLLLKGNRLYVADTLNHRVQIFEIAVRK